MCNGLESVCEDERSEGGRCCGLHNNCACTAYLVSKLQGSQGSRIRNTRLGRSRAYLKTSMFSEAGVEAQLGTISSTEKEYTVLSEREIHIKDPKLGESISVWVLEKKMIE